MKTLRHQAGASLIEVLVTILILSFGLLSLGSMMAYAVQLPKLAAYRATATALAASHVERMRANPTGFQLGNYDENLSYDATFGVPALSDCTYPNCTADSLATADKAYMKRSLRTELPAGGLRMARDNSSGTTSDTEGNLWIIWQEPTTFAALDATSSDNCPPQLATNGFTNPAPRCLYVRFKL